MPEYPSLAIPIDNGYHLVKSSDIIYCQADGSYTYLHLVNGQDVKVCRKLKEVQEMISNDDFLRIHHSHVINLNHLKRYSDNEQTQVILSNDTVLTVSRSRRSAFFEKFIRL
jgi:two-component system LytT family response regulator